MKLIYHVETFSIKSDVSYRFRVIKIEMSHTRIIMGLLCGSNIKLVYLEVIY